MSIRNGRIKFPRPPRFFGRYLTFTQRRWRDREFCETRETTGVTQIFSYGQLLPQIHTSMCVKIAAT